MIFEFSKKSKERMIGVDDQLITVFKQALSNSVIDFGIPEYGGLRVKEEQNILFSKGLSQLDGYKKVSNHQKGLAMDFYAYVEGKASWDPVHLSLVASCILTTASFLKSIGEVDINIKWGGSFGSDTFKGWDYPHIEITV